MLDVYVLLLTTMLLLFVRAKKQKTRRDHTFLALLGTVFLLLCGDMMGRCDPEGVPGIRYFFARLGNYIEFAGDPIGYLTAMFYVDSWITDERHNKGSVVVRGIISGYVLFNLVMITLGEIFNWGWYYYFENGIYHRGPLYVPRGIVNMLFCLFIGMYILMRRKGIHSDYAGYVVAFPLIVLFSGMLQVFAGGAAYEYAGTIFACLLLYIYVQNHNMDTDYLTGALNRRGIDEELRFRIEHYDRRHPFTTYMIDLDFFKNINDSCGHESGDEALQEMVVLLKEAFGKKAVVARYGGDEFLIINDAATEEEGASCVRRLGELCAEFNHKNEGRKPYSLGCSAGYALYSADEYPDQESYFRTLDHKMYEVKNIHHALRV